MRVLGIISVVLGILANTTNAEEPRHVLSWDEPFAADSDALDSASLVLLLITNDDPYDFDIIQSGGWCGGMVLDACRELFVQRSELRDCVKFQFMPTGIPKELTAGEPRNRPSRAMVVLCDHKFRLLSFAIGVPESQDLHSLVEDAEESAILRRHNADHPNALRTAVAERSKSRLSRLWVTAVEESSSAVGMDRNADLADEVVEQLFISLGQVYLSEASLRFGLIDSEDQTRLALLEQHLETRRPWCEALLPFLVGRNFKHTRTALVESVWGHPPIERDAEADEFVEWVDTYLREGSVVVSLGRESAESESRSTSQSAKRAEVWKQVEQLAQEHSFRQVDLQQLAVLMRSGEWGSVDLYQPSTARCLIFDTDKQSPLVIRNSDPPGRFAGILRRFKLKGQSP